MTHHVLDCPRCHGQILHDPKRAGQNVNCPHCAQQIQMPRPLVDPTVLHSIADLSQTHRQSRKTSLGELASGTQSPNRPSVLPEANQSLSFLCSTCQKKLKANANLAGMQCRCPHCGASVRAPAMATKRHLSPGSEEVEQSTREPMNKIHPNPIQQRHVSAEGNVSGNRMIPIVIGSLVGALALAGILAAAFVSQSDDSEDPSEDSAEAVKAQPLVSDKTSARSASDHAARDDVDLVPSFGIDDLVGEWGSEETIVKDLKVKVDFSADGRCGFVMPAGQTGAFYFGHGQVRHTSGSSFVVENVSADFVGSKFDLTLFPDKEHLQLAAHVRRSAIPLSGHKAFDVEFELLLVKRE